MNEPETTAVSPTAQPVAPAAAGEPTAQAPPVADSATPAAPGQAPPPAAPTAPPGRGGKPPAKKKPSMGGGGMPDRRMRDGVSVEDQLRFSGAAGPKMKELDDEIASELEAALSGLSTQNLFGAESSEQVRAQAAPGEGGQPKKGKIISIHGQDIFVEVPGGRSQGMLAMQNFPEGPPKVGDTVDISIEGYDPANGLLILSRKGAAVHADWSSVAEGMTVEARVIEVNKGGLSVEINGIRGFMPISQIDLYRVEKADDYVNQKLLCVVTEVKPDERNLVVSRRTLLEREREEQREKTWASLAEGQIYTGTVRNVRDFGAFVDIGGVDGLLHVSELSWKRVQDATQVLTPGQSVKVAVLKLDRETKKISLTLKGLEDNPWDTLGDRFPVGQTVKGTVTRTMDFGAFVELEPGIEGLIHISELARQRVWRVTDVVKPNDVVEVKIVGIDPEQRRIALSLRQAIVEAPTAPTDEDEEEEVVEVKPAKPRTTPLRGGIGAAIEIPFPPSPE